MAASWHTPEVFAVMRALGADAERAAQVREVMPAVPANGNLFAVARK